MTFDAAVGLAAVILVSIGFFGSPRGTTQRSLRKSQRRWRAIMRPRLLLGLLTFHAGASFVNGAVLMYLTHGLPQQPIERDLALGRISFAGAALLTIVFGPPLEEIMFRGYFLRLARWLPARLVTLLSCAFFGLGHVDVLSASVIGLIFLFLRAAGRSLRPAIVAHTLRNLVAMSGILALTLVAEKMALEGKAPPAPIELTIGDAAWLAAFGCLLLALGWRAFARAVRFVVRSRMWREFDGSADRAPRRTADAAPLEASEPAALVTGSAVVD